MASGKAQSLNATQGAASGGSFNLTNNSSLIGFKGTEDLGNGLKALFQLETNVNVNGTGDAANAAQTGNLWGSARDSYVGVSSKYGTAMGGYLSTPFRSALTSFDVMPGATGSGRIENLMGKMRLNNANLGNAIGSGGLLADSSVRSTAIAYALPTLYGFNGSIAYTGNNNGSTSTGRNEGTFTAGTSSVSTVQPQQAISMNLGWEGYGVGIKGAYQQAKVNYDQASSPNGLQGYTSYLVGLQYTGVPGLKVATVYNRNTLGTNATSATDGAEKLSNNSYWLGASYRFGNNEPRLSWATTSNVNGGNVSQTGGRQITANWGYYLSKRTQVYGIVSSVNNSANGIWNVAGSASNIKPTGGQNIMTYGAGLRTNF